MDPRRAAELPGARIRRLAPLLGFARAAELVSTGNERTAELLAAEGVDWRVAADVAMNRGDFLPENAATLAAVVRANVTRDALERAFARAAARNSRRRGTSPRSPLAIPRRSRR